MARAGAQVVSQDYPIRYRAVINNPISLSYVNEPVGIRVKFPRGLVPTADHLRVRNELNSNISFQWEPSVEPINSTDRGSWNGGSLREGTIWVLVPNLSAFQRLDYAVEVYQVAQGQSFTQAVTYAFVGGTDERFDTARIQLDFNTTKQWMPTRYRDKLAASENLFNGVQGGFCQYQSSAGVTRSSFTPTDVASNTRQRLGTGNFGYGVIFQDFEVNFTWNPETTVAVRERFRIWANGSVSRETYHFTTGAIISTAKRMVANVQVEDVGMVGTYNIERCFKEFVWSNKRMINGVRTCSFQYPAWTTETHSTNFDGTTNNNQQIWGWQGTTTLPSGAFFFQLSFFDLAYAAGDGFNQWQRRINPIYTWATTFGVEDLKGQLVSMSEDLISDFIPLSAADATNAYSGVEGLARITLDAINGTNQRALALAEYQAWGTSRGITVATAASYVTAWNAGLGWEFIGKAIEVLPWLRKAYLKAGDTVNAALVTTYIHAVADATVSMEVASGGGGQMKLDGPGADNYNAESSALSALAASLEVTNEPVRRACYERIANRYAAGYFAQTKMPYSIQIAATPSAVINAARSTYFGYQGFQQWLAHLMSPLPAPPQPMRQYAYEYTSPSGIELAWQYQLQQSRRGLPNTLEYPMIGLVFGDANESDWQWISNEMEYLYSKRRPGRWIQNQLENLTGTDVDDLAAAVDVRALCEIVLRLINAYN